MNLIEWERKLSMNDDTNTNNTTLGSLEESLKAAEQRLLVQLFPLDNIQKKIRETEEEYEMLEGQYKDSLEEYDCQRQIVKENEKQNNETIHLFQEEIQGLNREYASIIKKKNADLRKLDQSLKDDHKLPEFLKTILRSIEDGKMERWKDMKKIFKNV